VARRRSRTSRHPAAPTATASNNAGLTRVRGKKVRPASRACATENRRAKGARWDPGTRLDRARVGRRRDPGAPLATSACGRGWSTPAGGQPSSSSSVIGCDVVGAITPTRRLVVRAARRRQAAAPSAAAPSSRR
jgi:hypothetical protein